MGNEDPSPELWRHTLSPVPLAVSDVADLSTADIKRLSKLHHELAAKLVYAQSTLGRVCEDYLRTKNWSVFFGELTRRLSGALAIMDAFLKDNVPVDWNEMRVANADALHQVKVWKAHSPSTAHEAVWRIGQLLGIVYEHCKLVDDDPQTFDDECRLEAVKRLQDMVGNLPSAAGFFDSLDAESARWQRWWLEKKKPRPNVPGATAAAIAPADDQTQTEPPPAVCYPVVELDPPHINLDGKPWPLKYEAAVWLDALIKHGDWMSMSQFNASHPKAGGNVRRDRLDIPKEVAARIEGPTNAGFRWK